MSTYYKQVIYYNYVSIIVICCPSSYIYYNGALTRQGESAWYEIQNVFARIFIMLFTYQDVMLYDILPIFFYTGKRIKIMRFVLWMLTLMVYRNRIITFDNKSFVCTVGFDVVVYIGLFSIHIAYSNRQLGEYIHVITWIRTPREDRDRCRNCVPC